MVSTNPDVQTLLQQAMAALTRGDKPAARDLLTTVLEMDDRNEQAWLWLSGAVESPAEQRICLDNVLLINPGNTPARQGLAYLDEVEAGRPATDAAPAPAIPPTPEARTAEVPAANPMAGPSGPFAPGNSVQWDGAPVIGADLSSIELPDWMDTPVSGVPAWTTEVHAAETGGSAPVADPVVPSPVPEHPDPWAALRTEARDSGTSAPATPVSHEVASGSSEAAVRPAEREELPGGSWMDAFGGAGTETFGPRPSPSTSNSEAAPGDFSFSGGDDGGDLFPGIQPFALDSGITGSPMEGGNWGNGNSSSDVPTYGRGADAGAPAIEPLTDHGLGNLAADSPWANAFGGGLGAPPPSTNAPAEPYLHVRQPSVDARGTDAGRASSPSLISRPPLGDRAPAPIPKIACPSCAEMVPENSLSCPRCNYRFYAPCPHCGDFIDTSAPDPHGKDKCPHCERPVDKKALGEAPARSGSARPSRAAAAAAAAAAEAATPAAIAVENRRKKDKSAVATDPRAPAVMVAEVPKRRKPNVALMVLVILVLLVVLYLAVAVLPGALHVQPGALMPTALPALPTATP